MSNKPISVSRVVKIRGTDAYRERTQEELEAAIERARARRDDDESLVKVRLKLRKARGMVAGLRAEDQAQHVYDAVGKLCDEPADGGFAPDLIA